jgi:RNA polymerase sigma-70 factor (ECF subfamily)
LEKSVGSPISPEIRGIRGSPSGSSLLRERGRLNIEQIIADHHAPVYRYAYRLAGSVADAEDLTQQTFLVAQQKLHQLTDQDKARCWLFAVLRSCYYRQYRKRPPTPAASLELGIEQIPAREVDEDAWVDQEQLQAALDGLPVEFKVVVLLFYFEQKSYKEIAEELELPIGTVMSRLARAKGRLRQKLLQADDGDGGSPPAYDGSSKPPTYDGSPKPSAARNQPSLAADSATPLSDSVPTPGNSSHGR